MCHGGLCGNKLRLEKMKQNPINTVAGRSREGPTVTRTHMSACTRAEFDISTGNRAHVVDLTREQRRRWTKRRRSSRYTDINWYWRQVWSIWPEFEVCTPLPPTTTTYRTAAGPRPDPDCT